jgi:hypothetical protein
MSPIRPRSRLPSRAARPSISTPRRPSSSQEYYKALHKENWSIKDLLEACVRDTDIYGREIILERKSHRTVKARRRWVAQALNSPYFKVLFVSLPRRRTLPTVKSSRPYALRPSRTLASSTIPINEEIQEVDFSKAFVIQKKAPRWYKAQTDLLCNERAG